MTQPVGVDGTWTYPVSPLLATGDILTATQSQGGITSGASNTVTVLSNPPAVPSFTGTPYHAGDVLVSGLGTVGATITVFLNGVGAGTAVVSGTAAWSKPMAPLVAGDVLTAYATTAGGTSALSSPTTVLAAAGGGGGGSGVTGALILAPETTSGDLLLAGGTDALLLTGGNKLALAGSSRLLLQLASAVGGDLLLATGDALLLTDSTKVALAGAAFPTGSVTELLLLSNTTTAPAGTGHAHRTTDLSATGRRGRTTEH